MLLDRPKENGHRPSPGVFSCLTEPSRKTILAGIINVRSDVVKGEHTNQDDPGKRSTRARPLGQQAVAGLYEGAVELTVWPHSGHLSLVSPTRE